MGAVYREAVTKPMPRRRPLLWQTASMPVCQCLEQPVLCWGAWENCAIAQKPYSSDGYPLVALKGSTACSKRWHTAIDRPY